MKTVNVKSRYGNDRVWGKVRIPENWIEDKLDCFLELQCLENSGDMWSKRLIKKLRKMIPEGDVPILVD